MHSVTFPNKMLSVEAACSSAKAYKNTSNVRLEIEGRHVTAIGTDGNYMLIAQYDPERERQHTPHQIHSLMLPREIALKFSKLAAGTVTLERIAIGEQEIDSDGVLQGQKLPDSYQITHMQKELSIKFEEVVSGFVSWKPVTWDHFGGSPAHTMLNAQMIERGVKAAKASLEVGRNRLTVQIYSAKAGEEQEAESTQKFVYGVDSTDDDPSPQVYSRNSVSFTGYFMPLFGSTQKDFQKLSTPTQDDARQAMVVLEAFMDGQVARLHLIDKAVKDELVSLSDEAGLIYTKLQIIMDKIHGVN